LGFESGKREAFEAGMNREDRRKGRHETWGLNCGRQEAFEGLLANKSLFT
jgi:hypothetical protein